MKQIRVGMIGTGGFGTGRAGAYQKTEGFQVACGCRRSEEGRKAFAEEFGVPTFADWREVIELPEVDAVNIATPTGTHAEIALAALRKGKHILAEAAPAASAEEMRELIATARENELVFHVGSNYRFSGGHQAMAQAVPELGRVLFAEGISMWAARERDWYLDETLAGGLFLNVHYGLLDPFMRFLGEVEWVEAAQVVPPGEPLMWVGSMIVGFRQGALATIDGGHGPGVSAIRLIGTEGSFDGGEFVDKSGGERLPIKVEEVDTLARDCEEFRDEIRGEKDWLPEAEHNLRVVEVAALATQSAELGRRLNIPHS